MEPKLSIITVSLRAAEEIERTVSSVLEQQFSDYEYIFMDGGSRDGTVERIQSFRQPLLDKCQGVHITSEPDRGIYDAMNKGLDRARGQWVLMLNAGDCLADPLVLEDMLRDAAQETDVLYGDAVLRDVYRGRELFRPFPAMALEEMARGLPFCHQAALARRELLEKYRFDTRFSISADYDLFLRAWMDGAVFRYVPRVAAVFDCGGICMRKPTVTMAQCAAVRRHRNYRGKNPSPVLRLRAAAGAKAKQWLPQLYYSHGRGWRDRLPRDSAGRVRGDG